MRDINVIHAQHDLINFTTTTTTHESFETIMSYFNPSGKNLENPFQSYPSNTELDLDADGATNGFKLPSQGYLPATEAMKSRGLSGNPFMGQNSKIAEDFV